MNVDILSVGEAVNTVMNGLRKNFIKAFGSYLKPYHPGKQMNKNGQNKKERKRNQTMLRGRRCVKHSGSAGKGRSSYRH